MIRFCDNEVCCVPYSELDKNLILNYFFQGHMDDNVCVIDTEGKFRGKITYYSLINSEDVYDAVVEDFVVLDSEIWQKAIFYFSNIRYSINEHVLLPVVNKNRQLLCFAYEDLDADREIRMLRELSESPDALQFSDVYPEYKCVKINEFNELAYLFAKYLERQNIPVKVSGEWWKYLFKGSDCQELDYKSMIIYAEGVRPKKNNWIENLLETVSVEFECIDIIYEANIKNGIFKDAFGDSNVLLDRLQHEKEIVIFGTERESQDVYNYFVQNDIDVCCFVDERYGVRSHNLFGKKILSGLDVRNKYKTPIFIECNSKNSSWGFGGIDYWDHMGYKRNESIYLIKDYVDINESGLIDILKSKKVVLLGDLYLCIYLFDFLIKSRVCVMGYLDIEGQNDSQNKIPVVDIGDLDKETVCLIVIQEFYYPEQMKKQQKRKKNISELLEKNGLNNYTDYFSYTAAFLEIEEKNNQKYTKKEYMPKKIVLGGIEANSGNFFFRGLLDNHPSIMMLNYSNFNSNLFWICIRLSMEEPKNILKVLWSILKSENEWAKIFHNPEAFEEKMNQLLSIGELFTSQELFVIMHIAYMYMNGVVQSDIKNSIIYWEPHFVDRVITEDFAKWLGSEEVRCDIINIVRDSSKSRGGRVKWAILQKNVKCTDAYFTSLDFTSIEKKEYQWCDRLIEKFEDIKCNPKKILTKMCERWGIAWSDTLMMTTCNGKKEFFDNGDYSVSNFDMRPVYNTYEKYLSEIDRMRIMIINSPWQKKYQYPYLEVSMFTRRELQELFFKKFRFENMMDFQSNKMELEFKISLYQRVRYNLQRVRMIEIMDTCNE